MRFEIYNLQTFNLRIIIVQRFVPILSKHTKLTDKNIL